MCADVIGIGVDTCGVLDMGTFRRSTLVVFVKTHIFIVCVLCED